MKSYELNITNSGFTLLEMVMVILLIGFLAAYLIPQYSHYAPYAFIEGGMQETKNLQGEIESFYIVNKRFPKQEELEPKFLGIAQSPNLKQMSVLSNGQIQIIYDTGNKELPGGWFEDGFTGQTILLIPQVTENEIVWDYCRGGSVPLRFRPGGCKE